MVRALDQTNGDEPQLQCPRCHSTQVTIQKKGFGAGVGILGGLLMGPLGILFGFSGRRKLEMTCLHCGRVFKPGDIYKSQKRTKTLKDTMALFKSPRLWTIFAWIIGVFCVIAALDSMSTSHLLAAILFLLAAALVLPPLSRFLQRKLSVLSQPWIRRTVAIVALLLAARL